MRRVVAKFNGGNITSDEGGLLLREVEKHTRIIKQFANCFTDHRDPRLIEHTVGDLAAQRVYGLALGSEDLNDHDDLRRDPLLAILVGKGDVTGEHRTQVRDVGKALAGKSTLNRLELTSKEVRPEERYKKIVVEDEAVDRFLVDVFIVRAAKWRIESRISNGIYLLTGRAPKRCANQLRLWFSSVAYMMLHALRWIGLRGTEMAKAQCQTIRLKLLKIGAQMRVTVRKVWVSLAGGYPYESLFERAYQNLQGAGPVTSNLQ